MTACQRPLVYILVLNYCTAEDTLACIKTIRDLTYSNFRLLVIDNQSPDGSGKLLEYSIPPQEFLQTGKNLGYAGGNNLAIKRALQEGAEYILIVNPDVRLPPECLNDYVGIMSQDTNIAGLNSIQLQANGVDIDDGFRKNVLQPSGFSHKQFHASDYPEVFESPTLYGAALMLSARALNKVGGFDPLFFAYYEEIDLCRRLKFHDFKLVVTPKSPVLHIRTLYTKPLSRSIHFLRLKGYYLSRLKNRERRMGKTLKTILLEIIDALTHGAGNIYPYDTYPYDRGIILRTLAWLIWFLPLVWIHKKRETIPGKHYI